MNLTLKVIDFTYVIYFFSTYVRLGEWDLDNDPDCPENQGCNETPLDINVERIIAHKDFLKEGNHLNMHHDIALLRLKEPVQFTGIY